MHWSRGIFGRVFLIMLTAWALWVILPDFSRVVINYSDIGFEADNDGCVYAVHEENPPAGIAEGDRIDLTRTALSAKLALFAGMGGKEIVRNGLPPQTLEVLSHGCTEENGNLKTVTVTAKQVPTPLELRGAILLVEVAGVFFILVGFVLVWQKPSAMTWGFFLYAMWFNPGQYQVLYALLEPYPVVLFTQEVLQAVAQAFGYAGFLLFALRFPNNVTEPRWHWVERTLPVIVAAMVVLQLWSFGTPFGLRTESVTRASFLAGYGVTILALPLLSLGRSNLRPEDRQKVRWVLWACRIGLPCFIYADSNMATTLWQNIWSPPEWVLLLFYSVNTTVAIAVYHAVRNYRVIDVSFVINRGISWGLTWVIIGLLFAYVGLKCDPLIHHLFATEGNEVLAIVAIATLLFVLLIIEVLHDRLSGFFDSLLFRNLDRATAKLKGSRAELRKAVTRRQADDILVRVPVEALGLVSSAVFARDPRTGDYEFSAGHMWPAGEQYRLSKEDELVRNLAQRKGPLRLDAARPVIPRAPSGTEAPLHAVPIFWEERLEAVALYGGHLSGTALLKEEVSALVEFCAEASLAYEDIELKRLREENQRFRHQLGVSWFPVEPQVT